MKMAQPQSPHPPTTPPRPMLGPTNFKPSGTGFYSTNKSRICDETTDDNARAEAAKCTHCGEHTIQDARYETENDIVVETDTLNSGSDLHSTHEPYFGAR